MQFYIGDKVKFIDEVGGGVVIKLNSPISVTVQTDDGFEIPTMTKNLLKIEAKTAQEKIFVEPGLNNLRVENPQNISKGSLLKTHIEPLIGANASLKAIDQHLSLAFVPRDQTWLITGGIGVYLVNYSKRTMLFQYITSKMTCINGEIPSFSRYHLIEISREELDEFANGTVQVMVLAKVEEQMYFPSSIDFKIKGNKFYSENSYIKIPIFHEKSILHRLFDFASLPQLNSSFKAEQSQVEKSEKVEVKHEIKQPERNDEILMFKKSEDYAVVDMHIWEIVDDHVFMTSEQMLNHQLSYFQKCLNSALEHNIKKVVFIHGVGSGRLKDEIRAKLDAYHFITYKSASMQEFGVGATEIEISVNR